MLDLNATATFKRDRRRCVKRGYDMSLLTAVVDTLLIPAPLPTANKDHTLSGNWDQYQECHIQPNWLLIYRVEGNSLMLYRTGTHSDLFGS
jgi:mRNA interferase YafQ